ncbi:diadenylate cyclase CdaA [Youngiibacter multivorans]|uniref:Diadenylate cyclase n=1 Tax=Youngiibacter multivorans TaxID=937251 RepID=A0ABS4G3E4_9CLOT|nr:diadenylate cyclase CdaA [Youngiibacter multivorans]MBP1919062.1 diadenylate cyclase [Youngiibacter multivorans]
MENLNVILNTVKNINITSIIDILMVAYLIYRAYKIIKETRAEQLLKGILLILLLIPVSYILNLTMVYTIISKTITIGVLSMIIIFQPEIRRVLEHIGRSAFTERGVPRQDESIEKVIREITNAVDSLSESKTGALIVIERTTGLGEILGSGTIVDAVVSASLLENIFVPNTPLHDGATIIRMNRIIASGCVLPLTGSQEISKKLGTRHRAAIGLSEVSDAVVLVVSEETGTISLAVNGKLVRNYDRERLQAILTKILKKEEGKDESIRGRIKEWLKIKKTTS